jgi:hypothetical protein
VIDDTCTVSCCVLRGFLLFSSFLLLRAKSRREPQSHPSIAMTNRSGVRLLIKQQWLYDEWWQKALKIQFNHDYPSRLDYKYVHVQVQVLHSFIVPIADARTTGGWSIDDVSHLTVIAMLCFANYCTRTVRAVLECEVPLLAISIMDETVKATDPSSGEPRSAL